MKKTILTTAFAFAVLFASAQIKVYSDGKTYIGGTTTTPLSTLSVGGQGLSTQTGHFYNSTTGTTGTNALRGEHITPTSSVSVYATAGIITPGTTGLCVGVVGAANRNSAANGASAYGVYGYAGNANPGNNYGVYGLLLGTNAGAGVFGSSNGLYHIPAQYAGFFKGDIETTGIAYNPAGGVWAASSDARLKTEMTPFSDGMEVLRQINPIKYKYNGLGGLPTEDYYYGIKAQDMQEIAPYTVGTKRLVVDESETGTFNVLEHLPADSSGAEKAIIETLSYDASALTYVIINALKEQENKISQLEEKLRSCCNAPKSLNIQEDRTLQGEQGRNENGTDATQVIELAYSDNIVLYQNIPNPFGDETTINYYLPQTVSSAKMVFYDHMGKVIKEEVLSQKGNASVIIKSSELASGVYSYSLVVDEKVAGTKMMVKAK